MTKVRRWFKENGILVLFTVIALVSVFASVFGRRTRDSGISEIAFKNKAAKDLLEIKIERIEEEINSIDETKEKEKARAEDRKLELIKLKEKKNEISKMDAKDLDAFFLDYVRSR